MAFRNSATSGGFNPEIPGETLAERGNRLMSDIGRRKGLEWIDGPSGLQLRSRFGTPTR